MPCYHPLSGYWSSVTNPSGKKSIVFNVAKADVSKGIVQVPCGKCIGCRLEYSRQWAMRCWHEAQMHKQNCFITLTFDDRHLDPDKGWSLRNLKLEERWLVVNRSLVMSDFQKFMKRLRKVYGAGIRYFHCGEYGDKLNRPHHHACIFNFDFPDKKLWSVRDGVRLYRSKILEKLWPFGFSTVGDVTFDSAAYVARYITKKISGDIAQKHYNDRIPEYVTMSRRSGIGASWLDKFQSDVFPHDYVVVPGGRICKPARFYDNRFDLINHESFVKIKEIRVLRAVQDPDNRPRRLRVRENVKLANFTQLRRGLENGSQSV